MAQDIEYGYRDGEPPQRGQSGIHLLRPLHVLLPQKNAVSSGNQRHAVRIGFAAAIAPIQDYLVPMAWVLTTQSKVNLEAILSRMPISSIHLINQDPAIGKT